MPRHLIAVSPGEAKLEDVSIGQLGPTEIAIDLSLSAEKHGTTLPTFTSERSQQEETFDPETRLFLDGADSHSPERFPFALGNMGVGVVREVGDQTERFAVGDRVYGYLPIGETVIADETDRIWHAPADIGDEALVSVDPATVGVLATRYGDVRIGDHVAIFGLGAIGLMTVQLCVDAGALHVIGIDPISARRSLATEYGATATYDPTAIDVGRHITESIDNEGVDVTIETSGVYAALQDAIRTTRYAGRIVPVSFYHGEISALDLAKEWHFNRQEMISGARVESEPYRDHPRWDRDRVYECVLSLFEQQRLDAENLVTTVSLDAAPEAYAELAADPTNCLKLAVEY